MQHFLLLFFPCAILCIHTVNDGIHNDIILLFLLFCKFTSSLHIYQRAIYRVTYALDRHEGNNFQKPRLQNYLKTLYFSNENIKVL